MLQTLCEEEVAGRNHPNLVPVYTLVEVELKTPFHIRTNLQISKLCDGTLNDYLRHKGKLEFNFQKDEIFIILCQILEGLHFMHSKGLMHGNLNPNKGKLKRLINPHGSTLYSKHVIRVGGSHGFSSLVSNIHYRLEKPGTIQFQASMEPQRSLSAEIHTQQARKWTFGRLDVC